MQYVIEDLNPTKKKITVTVPADETEAAVSTAVAAFRDTAQLKGFRKGKTPAAIIEKRFHDEVYNKAMTDLLDAHFKEILKPDGFEPISRIEINLNDSALERGKDFSYSLSFEVLPEFEIPDYEGLAVEQEEAVVTDEEIDAVLDQERENTAVNDPVLEDRRAEDGDFVVVEFRTFDEQGKAMPEFVGDKLQLTLGKTQILPDLETLIKSLKVKEETTGQVTFPRDFFNPELAGRTLGMRVKLHGIYKRTLPALDDAFAQKAGDFPTLEALREYMRSAYLRRRGEKNAEAAQSKLLKKLLPRTDFPLPESLVADNVEQIVDSIKGTLKKIGNTVADIGKSEEDLRERARSEAELRVRAHVFLLSVARKKGLTLSSTEFDTRLIHMAWRNGLDFKTVKEYCTRNNLFSTLRDSFLADKGMEEIYSRAAVTMLPPAPKEEVTGLSEYNVFAPPASTEPEKESRDTPEHAASAGPEAADPYAAGPEAEDPYVPDADAREATDRAPAGEEEKSPGTT
ncbi:MAG: trigger factor [Desulfovibrio sp.]|jgi:trigger factor|nr:trigger factor [Desulfovibrio sp.]